MADIDWSDDEQVLNFFEDDIDDFEGFDAEDIELGSNNVLRNLPMSDFVPFNDTDLPADVIEGWTRNHNIPLNAPFTGESKLNVEMENKEPLDFFKLFVDDDFLNVLVQQTNKYAEQQLLADNLKEFSRQKKWRPVNLDEMKLFIGVVIAMGIVKKNDVKNYWSSNDVQNTPFFKEKIARDRFLLILRNLHLTDNERQVPRGQVGFDPLYKVRPFVDKLKTKFSEVYSPERDLSVDEATCAWKGRLRFKVYNPAKPVKFGIKLYQVCEATSGYCLGFDVYTASGSSECDLYADAIGVDQECTTTTRIVMGLMVMCGALHQGHHVYMDNYYTSPELFRELDLQNTYACGTLRKNRRGVPEIVKQKMKLKPSETIYRQKENMLAVKYHDKRDIHMLTTIHEPTMSVLNKINRNTNELIVKPTCIVDYVKLMGGVDLSDQISQYYSCLRKTTRWYKKLFFHLLNLCIVNAYLLYKKFSPEEKKMDHHSYRIAICNAIIAESPQVKTPNAEKGRKHGGPKPERLIGRHFPEHIPAVPNAKRKRPCRDCVACNPTKLNREGHKRKQTIFWCSICKVALCVPECFRIYHSVQNYRSVLLPGGVNELSDTDDM